MNTHTHTHQQTNDHKRYHMLHILPVQKSHSRGWEMQMHNVSAIFLRERGGKKTSAEVEEVKN